MERKGKEEKLVTETGRDEESDRNGKEGRKER